MFKFDAQKVILLDLVYYYLHLIRKQQTLNSSFRPTIKKNFFSSKVYAKSKGPLRGASIDHAIGFQFFILRIRGEVGQNLDA